MFRRLPPVAADPHLPLLDQEVEQRFRRVVTPSAKLQNRLPRVLRVLVRQAETTVLDVRITTQCDRHAKPPTMWGKETASSYSSKYCCSGRCARRKGREIGEKGGCERSGRDTAGEGMQRGRAAQVRDVRFDSGGCCVG